MGIPIDYVWGDDWVGIYVEGVLETQDESGNIDLWDFLIHHRGECLEPSPIIECDLDWLESQGQLPDKLEDVKVLRNGISITLAEAWKTE